MIKSELIIDAHYPGLNPVQLGQEDCCPRHSYGPAARTHWLLHYIVSGCGYFIKEGIRHEIHAGDTFVIAPYEETYYEADAEHPWHYIWIGFTANTLPCNLHTAVLHRPDLGHIFFDALHCSTLDKGKSAYVSAKLWELFSHLLEDESTETDYIDKAVNCMRAEYANGITIAEIAERLNINRSYFSALFKARLGVSPQAYLNALRLQKAAELMLKYQKSPSVAAASTGYSDIYNFSKMFKRQFGVSPRTYITQNKAKNRV